jgi:hypothetical protein
MAGLFSSPQTIIINRRQLSEAYIGERPNPTHIEFNGYGSLEHIDRDHKPMSLSYPEKDTLHAHEGATVDNHTVAWYQRGPGCIW